jgi:non-heme chloroperoxidase
MTTFTTPDGAHLFYKDWGSGKPVVLLHGWPLNADMWDMQTDFLASHGFRCIAYDRRGFGRSSQPWEGYDYDTLSDDLHALIDALDLDDVTLVGFSMGGGEVVRYLARHGSKRVAKAALVSAATPMMIRRDDYPQGIEPSVFEAMRRAIADDKASFLDGFGPAFTGAGQAGSTVTVAALNWTLFLAYQAGLRGMLQCVRAFSETDFRKDLQAVDVPALVIHGDADQMAPLELCGLPTAAALRHAQLKVYEGGQHALFLTDARRLNEDLLAFVQR